MIGARSKSLAVLVITAAAWGCELPTVPVLEPPYAFQLDVPDPAGGTVARTFHWDLGSTVRVLVNPDATAGRPDLGAALNRGAGVWNEVALLGEVRLVATTDPAAADAILGWSDADPLVSSTPACLGPISGAASTRGCLHDDGTALSFWPRRDGGASRVLFNVFVVSEPGMTQGRLDGLVSHELGHVLGILAHSPSSGDLMWGGALSTDRPSPADRSTFRSLYQTPPDLVAR